MYDCAGHSPALPVSPGKFTPPSIRPGSTARDGLIVQCVDRIIKIHKQINHINNRKTLHNIYLPAPLGGAEPGNDVLRKVDSPPEKPGRLCRPLLGLMAKQITRATREIRHGPQEGGREKPLGMNDKGMLAEGALETRRVPQMRHAHAEHAEPDEKGPILEEQEDTAGARRTHLVGALRRVAISVFKVDRAAHDEPQQQRDHHDEDPPIKVSGNMRLRRVKKIGDRDANQHREGGDEGAESSLKSGWFCRLAKLARGALCAVIRHRYRPICRDVLSWS